MAKKEGALDFAQLHAGWADKLARTVGVSLASVAPSVWHNKTGRAGTQPRGSDGPALTEFELSRAAQKAVTLAQQEKSPWTRADVIKYLGRVLPRSGRDPTAAAALLEDLADRALRSEFEPVLCLEAPELAEVPRSLLRADGRSVCRRHGGIRYATRAQLVMEERMVTHASADDAPRLTRAQAAHALGADLARLEDALAGRAEDTHAQRTQTGLREDQAAAALAVLTDGRRVSVINALGPVPGRPLDRLDWQRRASSIGAYRELSGYDHPAEPIGPEPTAAAPDKRAAWYEALAALGPVDGPDVRGMPDGTLLHLRDTYPTETAWAPMWAGDELRQVRVGAQDAILAAARAGAEAAAAERSGRDEAAARHRILAASYRNPRLEQRTLSTAR